MRMCEKSDYHALDAVFSFNAAIIDQFCIPDSGSIRKTFTMYVDLWTFLHLRRMRPGWAGSNFQIPSRNKGDLKSEACRVIAIYQPSRMGAMELSQLVHLTEDLWSAGSIEYLQAELCGATHKRLEKLMVDLSEPSKSSMQEAIKQEVFSVYKKRKKKTTLA